MEAAWREARRVERKAACEERLAENKRYVDSVVQEVGRGIWEREQQRAERCARVEEIWQQSRVTQQRFKDALWQGFGVDYDKVDFVRLAAEAESEKRLDEEEIAATQWEKKQRLGE